MKSTNIYRTVLTALFLSTVLAPAVADNNDVVISNAEENYRVTLRGGVPVVVNTAEVNYQLNSTINLVDQNFLDDECRIRTIVSPEPLRGNMNKLTDKPLFPGFR